MKNEYSRIDNPDALAVIKEMENQIAQLEAAVLDKDAQIRSLKSQVDSLENNVLDLTAKLEKMRQDKYGASTEKIAGPVFDTVINEVEEILDHSDPKDCVEPPMNSIVDDGKTKKAKKLGKGKASKKGIAKKKHLNSLPILTKQIHHNFEKDFLKNHPNLKEIAPYKYEILIHVAEHYEREIHFVHQAKEISKFDNAGKPIIIIPENVPKPLWENSVISPSLISDILFKKYGQYIPIVRQSQICKTEGIHISAQLMGQWVAKTVEAYLQPLYDAMHEDLKAAKYIHSDETTFDCLETERNTGRKTTYVWEGMTGISEEKQMSLFFYTGNRKAENLEQIFGPASKDRFLHSDGYISYFNRGFSNVPCMDHIRRPFVNALKVLPANAEYIKILKNHGQDSPEMKAFLANPSAGMLKRLHEILGGFREVYFQDKKLTNQNLSYEEMAQKRNELIRPLFEKLDRLIEPLKKQKPDKKRPNAVIKKMEGVTPDIENAADFYFSMMSYRDNYLNNGRTVLSNAAAERGIRPLAILRKNSLFFDTKRGADYGMVCFSLIQSAVKNGLNPRAYLEYVLTVLKDSVFSAQLIQSLLPYSKKLPECVRAGYINPEALEEVQKQD